MLNKSPWNIKMKYGIPCQAINPGRKKRVPEPTTRVTRSMVNKKFKQNEGIALNPVVYKVLQAIIQAFKGYRII